MRFDRTVHSIKYVNIIKTDEQKKNNMKNHQTKTKFDIMNGDEHERKFLGQNQNEM